MKKFLPILILCVLCASGVWAQDTVAVQDTTAVAQDTTVVAPAPVSVSDSLPAAAQDTTAFAPAPVPVSDSLPAVQTPETQSEVEPQAQFESQLVSVSGTVTAADTGEPLIGAMVIAGSDVVITSATGEYLIEVEPGTNLLFNYAGYTDYMYTVPAGEALQIHDVGMTADSKVIREVVVVGYGTREKGTIAGAVSTISADAIGDVPAASFDQALQGKATGLTVLSTSGEPSEPAQFTIRGTGSINGGRSPLFIMDGMPISPGDFNAIPPSDIASTTVLKDASATSIYGARAANGVVVITTKRGSAARDKATITYRMNLGFSGLANGKWSIMNTAERIAYEKEVGLTAGNNYDQLSKIDVNWRDEVFSSFAPLQNYELQVSGATDRWNYFVSGGYYNQEGLTAESDFSRINLRANAEAQATKWLKIGTSTMMAYETYSKAVAGEGYYLNTPISAARFMLPYWDPHRADGSIASFNDGTWKGRGENPLEWVENNPERTKKYKLISSLFLEATPVAGLTLRSQAGVDFSHLTAFNQSFASYGPNGGIGSAGRSMSDGYSLSITNTAEYKFNAGIDHRFTFLLGQEGLDFHSEMFGLGAEAREMHTELTNLSNTTRTTSWSDEADSYAMVSVFGRGEYSFKNRYYADVSVRGDWSSRFGKNNRGAAFWSVGFMWNILGEQFVSDNTRKWLTNAQIRFSTGTSGNSEIPYYDHLALVAGGSNYMDEPALTPSSKGNPNLSWEESWATNIAFSLGFWNRLSLEVDFYNKLTTKMLMEVPVPYSVESSGTRWENVGAMVNRGIEISLNADVVKTRTGFVWNINANASYNYNEVLKLYEGAKPYVNGATRLQVGHSFGEFYYNRFAGVNPANGDPLWYDKDGNIVTEMKEEDKVMLGKSYIAPWQGGFGTTLSWKGISLSAQFSWVLGRWMVNNDRYFEEGNGVFDAQNQSKRLLYDRWKKPGDVTDIPRHGIEPLFDTRFLEDASFLRLKNVQLSYTFPRALLAKTKVISGLRIFVQAQNLFTFTKFSGLDPEAISPVYAAVYPPSRQFSFGLDLTF